MNSMKRFIKSRSYWVNNLRSQLQEETQTVIHCNYTPVPGRGDWEINISPRTFLVGGKGNRQLKLLYVNNTPLSIDNLYLVLSEKKHRFTLVFQGLPKTWESFSLIEERRYGVGLKIKNIVRNNSGVYEVDV